MADFTNGFWDYYIAIITLLSIAGCGLLLWSQSKHRVKEIPEGSPAGPGTTGHVWDEDLTELNTPMPRWWMWLFYLTIVFALVYLVLYPGLGSYAGTFGWKSSGEYQSELKKADAEYGPLFDRYAKLDLKTVAADPQAQAIGERLFLTYCAQCHGSDARGNKGFPNLTDGDWLYGGDAAMIKTTIMHGRSGMMPAMGAAVGSDKDVENVAHYVRSLSNLTTDPIKVAFGKQKFAACIACHGADGGGNQAMGAPNLTDKVWLYGGNADTIVETINKGRSNMMPAFDGFLGEPKVHLLAAYVWGLSNQPAAVPKK
ncbi:cytochrome-c oxidase, cbb3-type subunit III [Massilia eurypsychrophila]|jgi:cytochrome c oxidase cbb3-type subunit 3|uniref:Cbb3-type cytochrome c oxidase subunit n=1 Tax=Massilia eurypsychrophila TaxID=1485217 RepID=A0A2G8TI44_9BURK|nr:cytochrome-c oxidase, cbb3-type subunit III [Massilia eurypsychrophila]PIL45705.1 cytochrome-c oxidase, cbb3-type subunit III [Massilia eurypsychrophila]